MRKVVVVLVVLIIGLVGAYVGAGFMAPPAIEIVKPAKFVGAATPIEVVVTSPGPGQVTARVEFEQNGTRTPLVVREPSRPVPGAPPPAPDPNVAQDESGTLRLTQTLGRQNVPALQTGPARIVVTASRPVLYGLRRLTTESARDVVVRLEQPRVSVMSTHHFINVGGTELVVYRVAPADVASGVVVGDIEYPGFAASGVTVDGIRIADPAVRVAFFALLHDQPVTTPIRLFARDEAGNAGRADFEYKVFPKPFKQSRIELPDALLDRVVPAILAGTTEIAPTGSTIERFVAINSELRRLNNAKIASFAAQTAPELLWRGVVFHPFSNNAVESAFADRRTYLYQGREVDRQVHLGFDLASYAQTPIVAANAGKVLFAAELGIYGNCVIIDHGMGLQSLYAHLSSMDVQAGATVAKDQAIGRSGITGMAGGDHLHFTMLVNGQMVNPVEWWDSHWIEDRILRKLRAAQ